MQSSLCFHLPYAFEKLNCSSCSYESIVVSIVLKEYLGHGGESEIASKAGSEQLNLW